LNERREFITLLGGAAAAWPLAARAQQGSKVWRIGWLSGASREATSGLQSAFLQGMRELGYVEGRDFVMESRFADGKYERYPEFAAELVRLKVDVILTGATSTIRTLHRRTSLAVGVSSMKERDCLLQLSRCLVRAACISRSHSALMPWVASTHSTITRTIAGKTSTGVLLTCLTRNWA
jgi:hypothetical protein